MAAHAEASDGRGSERWSLRGKTAIVTGGTKGIGKAIVEELASLGASVLTCSRTAADIEARIEEWRNKGYKVSGVMADVSTPAGREALANSARAEFGGALDILVNNVGMSLRKDSTEYSQEEYARIVDVNFNSVFLLTQLLHPMLKSAAAIEGARERGGSSVVNLSSIAGLTALTTGAPYAACKGAINRLTINWGCEWARDGIRVNAVAPGATKTAMTASLSRVPEVEQRITDRIPIGRWGEPNDISGLVAFLCMPTSRYVTSQVIAADGGISANGAWTPW